MATKNKTVYCCSDCGYESINWAGKCPSCGAWNTMSEMKLSVKNKVSTDYAAAPKHISDLASEKENRINTGISELDRVLGGGAVEGSLILVGGAPGIGKSTLLLQMCGNVCKNHSILYVSGEESERQLKIRAERLCVNDNNILIYTESNVDRIIKEATSGKPDILIIDSIQTLCDDNVQSAVGSTGQIRECTMKLMRLAKDNSITTFIVGHITKDGTIAGPKILEHMVDCVLYFEGDNNTNFRILRAEKNRFGSTNEIGVFEMSDKGLECVENPSEMLLAGRPENCPGTCVTCIMEGSRPLLAEVQALVCQGGYNPSRRSNGIDYNRVSMLLAVIEKRGDIPVNNCDAYINVIGGLTLGEPAADLATVLAIISSYINASLPQDVLAIGEVGLSGEIRKVTNMSQRISEAYRLGFKKCVVPYTVNLDVPDGFTLIRVRDIKEAIKKVFKDG